MRTEQFICTVYQDPDTCENVRVEYDIERGDENDWILSRVKILDPLTIEPDNLETDIIESIAFEEYTRPNRLVLDCKIEVNVTAETVRA